MDVNIDFPEEFDAIPMFGPKSVSASASPGLWVNSDAFENLIFFYVKGQSTAAADTADEDSVLTFRQATDSAGTGAKALQFRRYWLKVSQAATENIATNTVDWRKIEVPAGANVITLAGTASRALIAVFESEETDLDRDNDFHFVRCDLADTGSETQNGALVTLGRRRRQGYAAYNGRL